MVSFSVFIDTELNEENKSTVYTRTVLVQIRPYYRCKALHIFSFNFRFLSAFIAGLELITSDCRLVTFIGQ